MPRRKVWVDVDLTTWGAFRSDCLKRGVFVADELGRMIGEAVKANEPRLTRSGRKALQRVVDEPPAKPAKRARKAKTSPSTSSTSSKRGRARKA